MVARVIRGRARSTVGFHQLREIQAIDHFNHEACQVSLLQPLILRDALTDHMTDKKLEFTDQPGHPIPCVYTYDAALTFDGGGAYLGIVIATPLGDDPQSLARLKEKLSFYLESLYSEFGRQEWGTPVPGKMKIYVRVHPNSSEETFKILDIFHADEAAPRGVQLIITKIP